MDCPHCHQPLSTIEIETSDGHIHFIEECLNCGGHFIDPYLANFLTLETTRNIDSIIPKSRAVTATNPVCSKCGQPMSGIKDDSVPQTVTVFTCPNNHGDFFPKNQLYLFKQAQQSKIYFHKLWGIPLKSAFAVLIPILVIFSLAQENRIKASEILTPPLITTISSTQVLISFSTQKPARTSVRFTEGLIKTFIVSTIPQTNHLLSVEDLPPGTLFKYVIVIDAGEKPVSTSEYTFSTP